MAWSFLYVAHADRIKAYGGGGVGISNTGTRFFLTMLASLAEVFIFFVVLLGQGCREEEQGGQAKSRAYTNERTNHHEHPAALLPR